MLRDVTAPFPRPQRDRSDCWIPLDGTWEFRPDPLDKGRHQRWYAMGEAGFDQRITVPYAWETTASGVTGRWLPIGWYRRRVEVRPDWRRAFCIFAGVFHEATVWVNGRELGQHTGGYTAFELDITDALDDHSGVVVVRVAAPADKRFIPHGKQRSRPADDWDGCSFEPTSGIWQPVWLEERPATYINDLVLRPAGNLDGIQASVRVLGPDPGQVRYEVDLGDHLLTVTGTADGSPTTINLSQPRLWSPEDPYLYRVTARLDTPDGEDVVGGYTGLRRLKRDGGRLLLNDRPIFLRGVLDQGYWPRTGLTAPDDGALRRDLELAAEAGYNLVRKHMKFEDPRQLYWADRLGLLMWIEPPATGRYRPDAISAFTDLIAPMIELYGNHPSVVIWGLFNEEWGLDWATPADADKEQTVGDAVAQLRSIDNTRLVVDDSGWCHVDTDLLDWHVYTADLARWRRVVDGLADRTDEMLGIGLGPGELVPRPLEVRRSSQPLPLINTEYGGRSHRTRTRLAPALADPGPAPPRRDVRLRLLRVVRHRARDGRTTDRRSTTEGSRRRGSGNDQLRHGDHHRPHRRSSGSRCWLGFSCDADRTGCTGPDQPPWPRLLDREPFLEMGGYRDRRPAQRSNHRRALHLQRCGDAPDTDPEADPRARRTAEYHSRQRRSRHRCDVPRHWTAPAHRPRSHGWRWPGPGSR